MEATDTTARSGTRTRLLDAALKHFAHDGALGATLEEIRADAGVSVGALYHHFADKQALAAALFEESLAIYQSGFLDSLREHPGAEEGIRAAVGFHLAWCVRNPERATVLLYQRGAADSARLAEINRDFFAEVMAWWRPHVHYGALRDLDLDLIYALWLGPSQEYTRHALAGRTRRAPQRVASELADAAWLTLGADIR